MKRLIELLRNKYFLAVVAFGVWTLFFDKNDLISQYEYRSEVSKLQQEKDFYTKEIALVKKDSFGAFSNEVIAYYTDKIGYAPAVYQQCISNGVSSISINPKENSST